MNLTEVVLIKLPLFHLFKTATMLTLQSFHFASKSLPQFLLRRCAFVLRGPTAIRLNQVILETTPQLPIKYIAIPNC